MQPISPNENEKTGTSQFEQKKNEPINIYQRDKFN